VVLLLVGGYFFYKSAPPATAPEDSGVIITNNNEVTVDLPEGVTVENLADGNKLVKNEIDGYSVKITNNEYVYKNPEGNLKVQNYIEPKEAYAGSGGCVVSFLKTDYKDIKDVKKEEDYYCKDIIGPDCEYSKIEELKFNDLKWFKVYSHGSFIGTDNPEYITYKDKSMYTLYFSCDNTNFVSDILSNFSF